MLTENGFRRRSTTFFVAASGFLTLALVLFLVGCGTTQALATTQTPGATPTNDHGLAALPGYQVSLFASRLREHRFTIFYHPFWAAMV